MDWNTYHTEDITERYVYRYLSFEKLEHFLITGSLYLARLDRFEDNLEGITPYDIIELMARLKTKEKPKNPNSKIPDDIQNNLINYSRKTLAEIQKKLSEIQKKRFICCWFLGDVESMGMWDLYAPSGFAIRFERKYFQTIIKRGVQIPENIKTGLDLIVAGKVVYQNFDEMIKNEKQSLLKYSVFRKHRAFKHEEEYRLVGFHSSLIDKSGFEYKLGTIQDLEFDLYANPRMNTLSFTTYSEIIKHYSEKHKLLESKLKTLLELRDLKFN